MQSCCHKLNFDLDPKIEKKARQLRRDTRTIRMAVEGTGGGGLGQ